MVNWTKEEYAKYKRSSDNRSLVRSPDTSATVPIPKTIEFKDRYRNNWERQYAGHLEQRKHLKEIVDYRYEDIGFRIGENCFHYPDFFINCGTHFEIHDVKGHKRQNWITKVKACKNLYPWFKWAYTQKKKGVWEIYYI